MSWSCEAVHNSHNKDHYHYLFIWTLPKVHIDDSYALDNTSEKQVHQHDSVKAWNCGGQVFYATVNKHNKPSFLYPKLHEAPPLFCDRKIVSSGTIQVCIQHLGFIQQTLMGVSSI